MKKDYVINNDTLMSEWDYEKNSALGFFPDKLTCGSNKEVWWICSKCGYGWRSNCNNRQKGQGCPLCANKVLVKGKNDLQTLYPQIALKWNYNLNTNKPCDVFPHCNKKVWWICDKDERHIFEAKICHVTEGRIICPICSNQKIIVGVNDLATTNPELLKEWDYEKNEITPEQVTYGVNKKVYWKCSKGHSWKATIASRAGYQKTECPQCKNELKVSVSEKALAYYLSKYFEIEESKHFNWLKPMEIDIYISELKLGIEYDGAIWHKDTARDLKKDNLCLKNNVNLIRIREEGCPDYSSKVDFIAVKKDKDIVIQLKELIKVVFDYINHKYNTSLDILVDPDQDYYDILNKTLTLPKQNNLAESVLMEEWDYEKNVGLDPQLLSLGMHKKAWWKCKECGNGWQAMIYSRANGSGCPYCVGQKVLPGVNDLETLYPDIAQEWNTESNEGILPSQILPKSNKVFSWKCKECGNKWRTAVSHRTEGKNCPKCGRQIVIASHYKKVINIDTNQVFDSLKQAAESMNVSPSAIANCCKGISKTSCGFRWKFLE